MTTAPHNIYQDLPDEIAETLRQYIVPSTGALIQSDYGPMTYVSHRLTRWTEIITQLPLIYIDIDVAGIDYEVYDQGTFRLIPVVMMVYIPIEDSGIDDEDLKTLEDQRADVDVKWVYSQLESVFNALSPSGQMAHGFMLAGGSIPFEPFQGGDEQTGIRVRIAMLTIIAKQLIS